MKNIQMQMLQNLGIVKHFWSVKNFKYQQIKYVFSKKKLNQYSLVSMMSREWLKVPSSNLG